MNVSRTTMTAAAMVALLAGGVTIWTAQAQPPAGGPPATQPGGDHKPGRGPGGPGGGGADGERGQRSKWAEEFKTELAEHPRMGRALVALHDAKDYMEKAPNDFGGHKKAAIESIDASIKELKEAIKFDAKRERKQDKPGDTKPRDGKPGEPKPADMP